MNKRDFLKIIGGGVVVAATPGCAIIAPTPDSAAKPWTQAGTDYKEPRMRALSFAILCPNPHNRQPWKVDLSTENQVKIYADTDRLLPHTDPFSRQITIGLGCFAELMVMAAAKDGWDVQIDEFPEGADADRPLDERPVIIAKFIESRTVLADPLFAHVLQRRTNKQPYDTNRNVSSSDINIAVSAAKHGTKVVGSNSEDSIAELRQLTSDAVLVETETSRTYKESVDLFRIGKKEIDTNPDGIAFSGRMVELLSTFGQFSRKAALDTQTSTYRYGLKAVLTATQSAMGYIWMTTKSNSRLEQLNAGRDWMRVHLATTQLGVAMHPISQPLQEFPEMEVHYSRVHELLAENGGTVQMLARVGYASMVEPSPRWTLSSRII